MAALVLFGGHGPILTWVAAGLVVDESIGGCEAVIVVGGDRRYRVAADMERRKQVHTVLLPRDPTTPLIRYGLERHWCDIGRDRVIKDGVPAEAVQIVGREHRGFWQAAGRIATWLEQHPEVGVVALADKFESRRLRLVLNAVLTPQQATRVRVLALENRQYCEQNWWRSREGLKGCVFGYVRLAHSAFIGESNCPSTDDWDPDVYYPGKKEPHKENHGLHGSHRKSKRYCSRPAGRSAFFFSFHPRHPCHPWLMIFVA